MSLLVDDGEGISLGFESTLPAEAKERKQKKTEICQDFQRGRCRYSDADCPHRHVISSMRHVQARVCKHWLRGACINGANCMYLHEYDHRFVPLCAFFERIGECTNPECPFLHVKPEDNVPECAAYRRGFCPKGPQCPLRHNEQSPACPYYLAGFCPLGPQCPMGHPVQELHDWMSVTTRLRERLIVERAGDPTFSPSATCHREDCLDPGHTAPHCPGPQYSMVHKQLSTVREPGEVLLDSELRSSTGAKRCFTCHQEGHQAKDCPMNAGRGHRTFRNQQSRAREGGGALRGPRYPGPQKAFLQHSSPY